MKFHSSRETKNFNNHLLALRLTAPLTRLSLVTVNANVLAPNLHNAANQERRRASDVPNHSTGSWSSAELELCFPSNSLEACGGMKCVLCQSVDVNTDGRHMNTFALLARTL